MQRPVRLGLIGCGGIVRLSHAPGYRAIPELVRVTALADPVAGNLQQLGEMLAVPPEQRYADYRAMLERAELDAVTIATPHHMHAEQAIAAAAAGVAVISEKPMATSVEQAEQVLAAVQRHGVPYAVVHNFLFTPGMERARALLADGAVGTPFFGRAKSLFNKTDDQADPEHGVARVAGGRRRRHQRHRLPRDLPAGDAGRLAGALRGGAGGHAALRLRRGRPGAAAAGARQGGALSTVATAWCVPGGGGGGAGAGDAGESANLAEVHGPAGGVRVMRRGRGLWQYQRGHPAVAGGGAARRNRRGRRAATGATSPPPSRPWRAVRRRRSAASWPCTTCASSPPPAAPPPSGAPSTCKRARTVRPPRTLPSRCRAALKSPH